MDLVSRIGILACSVALIDHLSEIAFDIIRAAGYKKVMWEGERMQSA